MCGIYVAKLNAGSSSDESAGQKVLQGLKRLEYRGYDSWGVAVLAPADTNTQVNSIQIEKHTGKIGQVETLSLPISSLAIGHTRWATHGGVTQTNAHPHLASDGSLAVVQNGVVENYQELKAELEAEGYHFKTQTDTEVIVGLLESLKKQQSPDEGVLTVNTLKQVLSRMAGRSTVGILTQDGHVYAFRDGSPLVVGKNDRGDFFFSSDVLSLSVDATEYAMIENGQIVWEDQGELVLSRLDSEEFKPVQYQPLNMEATHLDKAGFDHFMVKEIYEQPQVWLNVMRDEAGLQAAAETIKQAGHVYILGSGSASFAAGQLAYYLRLYGVLATELKAYESASYRSLWQSGDVVVVFSQSGETADTIEVVEWMKEKGVKVVSLVNMAGSTLAALSDVSVSLGVGPEIGVASTKALTGQIIWSEIVAYVVGDGSLTEAKTQLSSYQLIVTEWLNEIKQTTVFAELAQQLASKSHLFVLGRGELYYPTLEFSLKLKEISYLHTEGFSGGELKHGVIALIEPGTPVVCLVAEGDEKANMLNAAAEVKARGAQVIGAAENNNELFDVWVPVPTHHHSKLDFMANSFILPSQLLTYHLALLKGLDPDKPRNLAKSVTVK